MKHLIILFAFVCVICILGCRSNLLKYNSYQATFTPSKIITSYGRSYDVDTLDCDIDSTYCYSETYDFQFNQTRKTVSILCGSSFLVKDLKYTKKADTIFIVDNIDRTPIKFSIYRSKGYRGKCIVTVNDKYRAYLSMVEIEFHNKNRGYRYGKVLSLGDMSGYGYSKMPKTDTVVLNNHFIDSIGIRMREKLLHFPVDTVISIKNAKKINIELTPNAAFYYLPPFKLVSVNDTLVGFLGKRKFTLIPKHDK